MNGTQVKDVLIIRDEVSIGTAAAFAVRLFHSASEILCDEDIAVSIPIGKGVAEGEAWCAEEGNV